MLTDQEKMRAARMYAVDFFRNMLFPGAGFASQWNAVLLDIASGKRDHFSSVQGAISSLNRLSPSDNIHNAVQALQYLRGRDRSFNTPHPMGDDPRRFLPIFAPLTTGYVNYHSSCDRR